MNNERKIKWIFFIIPLLFSSCALLFNGKTQRVRIQTSPDIKLVGYDSSRVIERSVDGSYQVKRAKKLFILEFQLPDSSRVKYELWPGLSPTAVFGNYFTPFWLGYIVDYFYDSKYRYYPSNYFSYNAKKHTLKHTRMLPLRKRYLYAGLGWSFANAYHASLFNNYIGAGSPLGANVQLEFFLTDRHAVLFEAGIAGKGYGDLRKRFNYHKHDSIVRSRTANSWYLLSYRFHVNRMAVGAGFSFSPMQNQLRTYRFYYKDTITAPRQDTIQILTGVQERQSQNLLHKAGLNFNVEYRLSNKTAIGGNWQMFMGDLNKKNGIYASHFFNCYLMCKIAHLNIRRKKQHICS